MWKKIVIFLLLFVFIFCYSFFFVKLSTDEVWIYGFGYNISNGLIPYRDFNMVVTPFISFLVSIFIMILGHHIWCIHILNSIIVSLSIVFIYKCIGKKSLVIIPLLFIYVVFSYNYLSLLIEVIIIYIICSNNKYKDYLLPLLVSLMFLTKQNIGIVMIIPMIYYSKNKIKSMIVFLIPIFILCIYLLINNAMYNFIDYCFLGLFDFGSKNSYYSFLTIMWLIINIFLIIRLVRAKFKDELCFYVLCFQIIVYPMFDHYHFIYGFIIFIYYLIINYKFSKYIYKYLFIISFVFYVLFIDFFNGVRSINMYINKDSYLFGRNIDGYVINLLDEGIDIYNNMSNKCNNIYYLLVNAYIVKLSLNIGINKYDLINDGNMGYKGYNKYISEIDSNCDNDKCIFILDKEKGSSQINSNIRDYVINNYDIMEIYDDYVVYTN